MNQLVIMNNQQAVTTSLSVAENFNKQHGHVLRDIEAFKKMYPILERCSKKAIHLILTADLVKHIS